MSEKREFRFGFAAVLMAFLWAVVSADPHEKYERAILILLAVAIPAAVFRGLIADHQKEEKYKAMSGVSGVISYGCAGAAFAFLFAGHDACAAVVFVIACLVGCFGLWRGGK